MLGAVSEPREAGERSSEECRRRLIGSGVDPVRAFTSGLVERMLGGGVESLSKTPGLPGQICSKSHLIGQPEDGSVAAAMGHAISVQISRFLFMAAHGVHGVYCLSCRAEDSHSIESILDGSFGCNLELLVTRDISEGSTRYFTTSSGGINTVRPFVLICRICGSIPTRPMLESLSEFGAHSC